MRFFAKFQSEVLLAMRLVLAAIFLYAGMAKFMFWSGLPAGMEMSSEMVMLMKFLSIVEPLGAVALIAGFLTTWAALGLAIIMVGANYFVKVVMNAGVFTSPAGTGMDYTLLILAGCLVLLAFGPGRWSVDMMWKGGGR